MNAYRIFGLGEWLKKHIWCLPCRSFRAEAGPPSRLGGAWVRVSCHQNTLKRGHQTAARGCPGFTLVELLVVIATVAVLAAVLLPALAGTKPNGQAFQCLNNTRRLTLGWTMYASENSDIFMWPTKLVSGQIDWSASTGNTNVAFMLNSDALIAPYVKSAALFKCPSDIYQSPANPGPRIRSYSLDYTLGGSSASFGPTNYLGRKYFAPGIMSELNMPGPANIYVILDENPDSIDDAAFMLDAGHYAPGSEKWRNYPGSFHNGSVSISFADGHSEIHQWLDSRTLQNVQYKYFSTSRSPTTSPINTGYNLDSSADYEWLENRMPYR